MGSRRQLILRLPLAPTSKAKAYRGKSRTKVATWQILLHSLLRLISQQDSSTQTRTSLMANRKTAPLQQVRRYRTVLVLGRTTLVLSMIMSGIIMMTTIAISCSRPTTLTIRSSKRVLVIAVLCLLPRAVLFAGDKGGTNEITDVGYCEILQQHEIYDGRWVTSSGLAFPTPHAVHLLD